MSLAWRERLERESGRASVTVCLCGITSSWSKSFFDSLVTSLRRHFSGGPQQALPPVPVLRARRRIERGEEITWTYPPEFIRRLQSVGAW